MYLKDENQHKIILLGCLLIPIILGVLIFIAPPGADPDPCWGFLVMHCMEMGHPFNYQISPAMTNLAQNQSDFLSWWSPGQYLLPYLFKSIFKVNTGHAVALTITFCNIAGLIGFYQFFKKIGFSKKISAISVAFISCQYFFMLAYTYYTGGEVLLFAFAGWFLYGCFSFEKISWQCLVFVLFAGILGFVSKSSSLWMFAAGLACIWINISAKQTSIITWLRNGVVLAIPAICSIAIIYFFYLSKGPNPSSATEGLLIRPETFSFPLSAPFLAGFSIDELVDGLVYQPDGPGISYLAATIVLIVLALASLAFTVAALKWIPYKNYRLVFVLFYIACTLFFTLMYIRQAAISYEGRHFRIMGLLATPGIVYFFNRLKATRFVFAAIWLWFGYKSVDYFRRDYSISRHAPRGVSGLSQQLYDQPTLNYLIENDAKLHNVIFAVTCSDIATEIIHNRLLTIDIGDMSPEELAELQYSGYGGPIYMLMAKKDIDSGVAKRVCKSFVNYHHFEVKQLSSSFYIYIAQN